MEKTIITIARQYGSGGRTVGKMLAKRLGIPYYDREIIEMAAEDSGINAVLFQDEKSCTACALCLAAVIRAVSCSRPRVRALPRTIICSTIRPRSFISWQTRARAC